MLNEKDSIQLLQNYFKENKVATMNELIPLLETTNRMSVFRRLQNLNYISSFSAAGKYYTLKNIPQFGSTGLWIFNSIGFSRLGNLKDTLINFIEKSEAGKTHEELKKDLKINLREALHHALLDLVKSEKISRVIISNDSKIYLYTSTNREHKKLQITCRDSINVIWDNRECTDWLIIEVLASIIRTKQINKIDYLKIISDLSLRKVMVTKNQIEDILNKFNLKKTSGYR